MRNLVEALRQANAKAAGLPRAHRLKAALFALVLLGLGLIVAEVRQDGSRTREVRSVPRSPDTTESLVAVAPGERRTVPDAAAPPPATSEPSPGSGPATGGGEAAAGSGSGGTPTSGGGGAGAPVVVGGTVLAVPAPTPAVDDGSVLPVAEEPRSLVPPPRFLPLLPEPEPAPGIGRGPDQVAVADPAAPVAAQPRALPDVVIEEPVIPEPILAEPSAPVVASPGG